jgi:hypothetical protein
MGILIYIYMGILIYVVYQYKCFTPITACAYNEWIPSHHCLYSLFFTCRGVQPQHVVWCWRDASQKEGQPIATHARSHTAISGSNSAVPTPRGSPATSGGETAVSVLPRPQWDRISSRQSSRSNGRAKNVVAQSAFYNRGNALKTPRQQQWGAGIYLWPSEI